MSDSGYPGQLGPGDWSGDFNAISFLVNQIVNRLCTATEVEVMAVTNTGGVHPIGTVDVRPMVNLIDQVGTPSKHGIIYGLPYVRMQGGATAFIIDPKVGDKGLAVFCAQDISSVKASNAQANPGSRRRFDWADGIYIGMNIGGVTPTQYVLADDTGITILSPTKVTVQAPEIDLNASTKLVITTPEADIVATITNITSTTANVTAATVNLGPAGTGLGVARIGDTVVGGVITSGSTHVKAT